MKKFLISATLSLLYPITALAGAISPGLYRAVSDLNIRSTPQLTENRINYFKKGDQVVVTKVLDRWCQIEHPRHPVAFVKCFYLTNSTENLLTDTSPYQPAINTPVANPSQLSSSSSTQLLKNLSEWLNTNDSGNNYINDTFWNAQQKALFWDQTAELSEFQFFYDEAGQIYCRYSFSSANNTEEYFIAQCLDSNLNEVTSSLVKSNKTPRPFSLPPVLFKDFVSRLQNSTELQQDLANFFPKNAQFSARFQLKEGPNNQLLWSLDLFDLNSGKIKVINLEANSPTAPLVY